jgi:hypothetical protein
MEPISQPDANGQRTVTDGATSFTLSNQDFNVRSFRSNFVLRWEWRPGSTLFVVWQQDRFRQDAFGQHVRASSVQDALRAPGNNFFAIKVNYWIPLR